MKTPEPKRIPTVVVAETAFPSASTTERCEVKLSFSEVASPFSGDMAPVAAVAAG